MTVTHDVLKVLISPFRAQNPLLFFSIPFNSMWPLSAHNLHLGNESDILTFFKDMTQNNNQPRGERKY